VSLTGVCRFAYLAGLILGLLVLLGAKSGTLTEPPYISVLQLPFPGARQKPPVRFSHRVHEARQVACTQCHHEYQGRRNVWREGQPVKQCRDCHGSRPQAHRLDLKNAYHRQCKGCHLRLSQQRRQAGPIECQGCHRPPERRGLDLRRDGEGQGLTGESPATCWSSG
jgi:hypothetical protein